MTGGAIGSGAALTDPELIGARLAALKPFLDIDGNGQASALSDGLLLIRYLSGLRGDSLVNGAIDAGATRKTSAQIEQYIESLLP